MGDFRCLFCDRSWPDADGCIAHLSSCLPYTETLQNFRAPVPVVGCSVRVVRLQLDEIDNVVRKYIKSARAEDRRKRQKMSWKMNQIKAQAFQLRLVCAKSSCDPGGPLSFDSPEPVESSEPIRSELRLEREQKVVNDLAQKLKERFIQGIRPEPKQAPEETPIVSNGLTSSSSVPLDSFHIEENDTPIVSVPPTIPTPMQFQISVVPPEAPPEMILPDQPSVIVVQPRQLSPLLIVPDRLPLESQTAPPSARLGMRRASLAPLFQPQFVTLNGGPNISPPVTNNNGTSHLKVLTPAELNRQLPQQISQPKISFCKGFDATTSKDNIYIKFTFDGEERAYQNVTQDKQDLIKKMLRTKARDICERYYGIEDKSTFDNCRRQIREIFQNDIPDELQFLFQRSILVRPAI